MTPVAVERVRLTGLVAVAVLLSAPALLWPLMPDEAGFLLVAQHWDPAPHSIYGPLWVDRPPGLIAVYAVADALMGELGPRVVVVLLTVVAVLAAHRLGRLLGGPTAAWCAAATAVVLTGWPSLATWAAKSESLGVPLVVVACWLGVEALHADERWRAWLTALGAGAAATLAVGMKQSLVSGVVFLAVLGIAHLLARRDARAVGNVVALAAGGVLPVLVLLGWGVSAGVDLSTFWDALVRFRSDALDVIAGRDSPANRLRGLKLAGVAVVSGVALVLVWFLSRLPRALAARRDVALATTAMLAVDTVAMVLGGSYWAPYLQALTPATVLAVALLATVGGRTARAVPAVVGLLVVPLLVSVAVDLTPRASQGTVVGTHVGRAVGDAAAPDDSVVVLYGAANVVQSSGLSTPYRHLWSLPVRTLDPDLVELRGVLAGPEAPTWLVLMTGVGTWGLDADGATRELIGERYVRHGSVCGADVWLLGTAHRPALPAVDCDGVVGP